MELKGNAVIEIRELRTYLEGFADAKNNERIRRASHWLKQLERSICGAGFIGCRGGEKCTSDHK